MGVWIKRNLRQWLVPNEWTRDRWIRRQLQRLEPGKKILDVGAGEQPYRQACGHLMYFAQDFGEYRPQGEGLQMPDWQYGKTDYQGNAWEIAEQDQFFDYILCTEVLEHIPYPSETLKEFSRLLKPGGILLLTAPYACLPHMQPYFFYSGFSREYYEYQLAKNQFKILEITANGSFFATLLQEMLRGLVVIKPLVLRLGYGFLMLVPILIMKVMSWLVKDQQLVFGYHVRAEKLA